MEPITLFKLPAQVRESAPMKVSPDYACDHLFWALVEHEDDVEDFMGVYGALDLADGGTVLGLLCHDCSDYWDDLEDEIHIKPTPDLRPPKLFSEDEVKRMWGHVKLTPWEKLSPDSHKKK